MDRRQFLAGAAAASAAFNVQKSEDKRGELQQSQYAIVELLGFKKLCGRLSQGSAGLLQLDVPVEGGFVTKLINPASVYSITIVDADAVASYARFVDPIPAIELETPLRQRGLGFDDRSNDDDY